MKIKEEIQKRINFCLTEISILEEERQKDYNNWEPPCNGYEINQLSQEVKILNWVLSDNKEIK